MYARSLEKELFCDVREQCEEDEPGSDDDQDSAAPAFHRWSRCFEAVEGRGLSESSAEGGHEQEGHDHGRSHRERDHGYRDASRDDRLCGQTGQQWTRSGEASCQVSESVENVAGETRLVADRCAFPVDRLCDSV